MMKDEKVIKDLGQRLISALSEHGAVGAYFSGQEHTYVLENVELTVDAGKWIIEVENVFRQLRPWYGEKPISLSSIKRIICIRHTYDDQGVLEITRAGGRKNTIYFHYYYFDLDTLYNKIEEARKASIDRLEEEIDDLSAKLGKKLEILEKIKELEL